MNADNIFRRLRGAIGNAVVWGAGWAALGFAGFATLKVAGLLPASVIWLDALLVAARFGLAGGIAGGVFSLVIGFLYRGRRLSEISAVRFGIGGGIVAGVLLPGLVTVARLLSGDGPLPLEAVRGDILTLAVFGAVAAGVSLKLAQRAQSILPGRSGDRPALLESGDRQVPMGAWDAHAPARRGVEA